MELSGGAVGLSGVTGGVGLSGEEGSSGRTLSLSVGGSDAVVSFVHENSATVGLKNDTASKNAVKLFNFFIKIKTSLI